jgi:hypothetical protein
MRNPVDKDPKKQRSFSISARHAVSSLDVSLDHANPPNQHTSSASRVSISDFKSSLFQKNKTKAKSNESNVLPPPRVESSNPVKETAIDSAYGDYDEDEYQSSDTESDFRFPEIQIAQIVEKSPEKKVYKKPGAVKQEDPFLKDLTARLQLKQRQKKAEEEQSNNQKETSKSPKHPSSKSSSNTSPIHQFSLFRSASKPDDTSSSKEVSTGSTPKRFNLHSFSLTSGSGSNKSANPTAAESVTNGKTAKNVSPTHVKAAEAFSRSFTKLQNFNYGSLTRSGKDKASKGESAASNKEATVSPKKEEKQKSSVEASSFKPVEFKSHKFLDMPPNVVRAASPNEQKDLSLEKSSEAPNRQQGTTEPAYVTKTPLRSIKTPIFSMLNSSRSPEKPVRSPAKCNGLAPSRPVGEPLSTPVKLACKSSSKGPSTNNSDPVDVTLTSTASLIFANTSKPDADEVVTFS